MASNRRGTTTTRFLEDIADDAKGFVDDLLSRTRDLEGKGRDAVRDMHGDGDSHDSADVAALRATLEDLSAKVDELTSIRKQQQADLETKTKGELQELADKRGLTEVNQNTQTKDEMIAAIRGG